MMWQPGDEAPEFGDSSGLPVGILGSARYENRDLPLPLGGRLFLYSDGASELWTSDDTVLGEEGLAGDRPGADAPAGRQPLPGWGAGLLGNSG